MSFPSPPSIYDAAYMASVLRTIEAQDKQNRKLRTHIEMTNDTFIILRSPDGTKWKLTVSNAGTPGFSTL